MVNVPVASLISAFEALERVSVTVSSLSSVLSVRIGTVKVLLVSSGEKVSVRCAQTCRAQFGRRSGYARIEKSRYVQVYNLRCMLTVKKEEPDNLW